MAADKQKDQAPPAEAPPASAKKKKLMAIGGGALGVVVAAFLAASLAAPAKKEYKVFEGPWVVGVVAEKITTNLKGDDRKRYLAMRPEAYYEAYDQGYAEARVADPVYQSLVKDVLLRVSSRRTVEEVNSDVGNAAFREELRQAIDPLMFPVQVGKSSTPADPDPRSGLRMGISAIRSNFRASLYDGALHVDQPGGTIRLGRGQPVPFDGDERDLRVEDEHGRFVHLDVSRLKEGFQGEVMVGVHGRIREVLLTDLTAQ